MLVYLPLKPDVGTAGTAAGAETFIFSPQDVEIRFL